MSGFVEDQIINNCHNCNTILTLDNSILCNFCNKCECRNDENYIYESDYECECITENDNENKIIYCKKCTNKCHACNIRGCKKCVTFACCDCGYDMCERCRDSEILCGCYGTCYTCGKDVNRGSHGWPCGDCEKWYCGNCLYNNPCIECNPDNYEDNNTDNEDNNTDNNSDEDANNTDNNDTNNIIKGG